MKARLLLVVLGLLVAGALVAGCGGNDKKSSDTKASTQAIDSGGAAGGGAADASNNPQVKQAVEACKTQVQANPQLSEGVKADLQKICEKAASGDEQAVRQSTKEVCIKIVEETAPAGPVRDQAKTACEQATTSP